LFTEEEAISIFFVYQSLRYCSDLPFNTEIESVLKKFYMCLTDDAKKKADKMDDYVVFWNPKRKLTNPFLRELLEASILNKNVEFLYDSKQGKTIKHVNKLSYTTVSKLVTVCGNRLCKV
jgi:predicted DNA-binding transcriptional regulator YafY